MQDIADYEDFTRDNHSARQAAKAEAAAEVKRAKRRKPYSGPLPHIDTEADRREAAELAASQRRMGKMIVSLRAYQEHFGDTLSVKFPKSPEKLSEAQLVLLLKDISGELGSRGGTNFFWIGLLKTLRVIEQASPASFPLAGPNASLCEGVMDARDTLQPIMLELQCKYAAYFNVSPEVRLVGAFAMLATEVAEANRQVPNARAERMHNPMPQEESV